MGQAFSARLEEEAAAARATRAQEETAAAALGADDTAAIAAAKLQADTAAASEKAQKDIDKYTLSFNAVQTQKNQIQKTNYLQKALFVILKHLNPLVYLNFVPK
jgi:hypothetical protein